MNNKIEKNEVNEILNTIFNYKKLIFGITIIFIIVASIYAFLIQKPIYEADLLIKIATKNTFVIEDESTMVQILSSRYDFKNHKNMAYISNIIKPRYSKGVIRIFAKGYSTDSIKSLLHKEILKMVDENNQTLQLYIKDQQTIIDNVKKDIENMEHQTNSLISQNKIFQSKLDNIDNSELAFIGVYSVSMLRNDRTIIELNQNILKQKSFLVSLNTTLQPNRTFNTQMVGDIHFKPKAITPSIRLILILGFVTGLLFSILLSLFLQFLKDRRE